MRPMTRCALATAGAVLFALGATALAADPETRTIYAGTESLADWCTNQLKPVPAGNAQADGLNPHGSGGYIVMYEEPVRDFVLEFDYKLSKGCNSGVFLRVGDPKQPVMTGLEVAIDDTTGTGLHDTGAIYDLVAPKSNPQKPVGEWNRMKIEAKGPKIAVTLNGELVSTIDQDEWPEAGLRPDGSKHKFEGVAIKDLNQKGYLGFQDHGQDCWYKDVKLTVLD